MDAGKVCGYRESVAIDVRQLSAEAERLTDLSATEREMLTLLQEGLSVTAIAERLKVSEADVYRAVADLLDAIDYPPPSTGADEIHQRTGTLPATQAEIEAFHQQLGPFATDAEG